MLKIDCLNSGDVPACAQIISDNPLWGKYGVTASSAEKMLRTALSEDATILAAKLERQVAGFVWYAAHGAWDRSGYIRIIGIAPQHQGQKIGEKLLSAAENKISKEAHEVFLLVTESNTAAQRFYQRLGYSQVGAIPDYIQAGITELIFFKKLPLIK